MKITKKKIKISGMHCTSCAMTIDFDVEDLKGVKSAKTSYTKQELEVEIDEDVVKMEDVFASIKKLGYEGSLKEN